MSDEFKNKLVWSDDPKDKIKIEEAKPGAKVNRNDMSLATIAELKWTAVFRIEKAARGGKTVTVIDQLPRNENWVKDLCKELKSKCGTGGTFVMSHDKGLIEIQGDKRAEAKALFEKKGFKFKGM